MFLEVGPHPVVSGNIREVLAHKAESGVSMPTLSRGESDHDTWSASSASCTRPAASAVPHREAAASQRMSTCRVIPGSTQALSPSPAPQACNAPAVPVTVRCSVPDRKPTR